MDLLAIIKGRINDNATTSVGCVAHTAAHEPADTHDASEIHATDVLVKSASCTPGHDADDAYSEPVLGVARNWPNSTIKKECVIPKSNQPHNYPTGGTAPDNMEIPIAQVTPVTRQRIMPKSKTKAKRPAVQGTLDLVTSADSLLSGVSQYPA